MGSAGVKGLGETGRSKGMGSEGMERSEGDSEVETTASQRPRESDGETRS